MENKNRELKLGLALGGGSALGFAHLGVLKALEENKIPVDCIAGTSTGAIMGALYAFGVPFRDIEKEAEKLSWKKIGRISPSSLGLSSNENFKKLLEKHIGKKANIEDAIIPLAVVATDIETGSKVVLRSGNAVNSVLASACMPGLLSPVKIGGLMLVDGGLVENVPVSAVKEMGTDIILAVNLLKHRKYAKPKNIMDVLASSFDMVNRKISESAKQDFVDVLIEPDLSSYYMGDIKKWKEISHAGYMEAQKHLEHIRQLKQMPAYKDFFEKIKKLFK